jgi:hypothetical protein
LPDLRRRDLRGLGEVKLLQGFHPGQMRVAQPSRYGIVFTLLDFRRQ